MYKPGHEVYVLFEGVFALDEEVDTQEGWVTLRTGGGHSVHLPMGAVLEWDVDVSLHAHDPGGASGSPPRGTACRTRHRAPSRTRSFPPPPF